MFSAYTNIALNSEKILNLNNKKLQIIKFRIQKHCKMTFL